MLEHIIQDYQQRIAQTLPQEKAPHVVIVGIIGLIGSGKTTTARLITEKLKGAVLVKSDSARFLLNEAGLDYSLVKDIIYPTAAWLLGQGYSVVFDGDSVDQEKRDEIEHLADKHNAAYHFVRIKADKETSLKHLHTLWEAVESGRTPQTFDNFLVVTRGKEQNLLDRIPLHEELKDQDIPNLAGVIENTGTREHLERQIDEIIKIIGGFA